MDIKQQLSEGRKRKCAISECDLRIQQSAIDDLLKLIKQVETGGVEGLKRSDPMTAARRCKKEAESRKNWIDKELKKLEEGTNGRQSQKPLGLLEA